MVAETYQGDLSRGRIATAITAVLFSVILRDWIRLTTGEDLPFFIAFPAVAVVALALGSRNGMLAAALAAAWLLAGAPPEGIDRPWPIRLVLVGIFAAMSLLVCMLVEAKQKKRLIDTSSLMIELGMSEERLRLALDEMGERGVLVLDRAGTIVDANVGVRRLTGWTESELIGQPFAVLCPSVRASEAAFDCSCRQKSGDTFTARLTLKELKQGPRGYFAVIRPN